MGFGSWVLDVHRSQDCIDSRHHIHLGGSDLEDLRSPQLSTSSSAARNTVQQDAVAKLRLVSSVVLSKEAAVHPVSSCPHHILDNSSSTTHAALGKLGRVSASAELPMAGHPRVRWMCREAQGMGI